MTDPAEVRAPPDLVGTVESITAAPTIKSGPGRVVLTTVSHNNRDVYELTIKNADGKTETHHRFSRAFPARTGSTTNPAAGRKPATYPTAKPSAGCLAT